MTQIDDYIIYQTEQLFNYKFRSYQVIAAKKIIRSLVNSEMAEIPLNWARQTGKTDLCKIILTLAVFLPLMAASEAWTTPYPSLARFKLGFWAAFVAPVEWQAKVPLGKITDAYNTNPALKYHLSKLGIIIIKNNTMQFYLSNGSKLDVHTAATGCGKPSGTYHLLWFTESQALSAYAVRSVFSPTLASTQGTKVFDGTAESVRNDFWQVIQRERQRAPKDKSITITYDRAAREIPGYIDYVETELTNIPGGKESPFFKLNYLLEWVGAGSNLISWDVFNSCVGNYERGQIDKKLKHAYFGGVDYGKVQDSTVCTLLERWPDHLRVIDWLEIPLGISHLEQAPIIAEWFRSKEVQGITIVPDSTGAGDMPCEMLTQSLYGYANVQGLCFSPKSKHAMYMIFNGLVPVSIAENRSTKLYWPQCSPNDKEWINFQQQMLDCLLDKRGNYYTWEAPKREQGELDILPHDDYCASLLLGCFAAEGLYA